MDVITPSREVLDIIKEEGGDVLDLCYQCGTCTATCPWNNVKTFPVRKLMHRSQLGLIDFGDEYIWQCVGCRMCMLACPYGNIIVSEKGCAEKCDLCDGDPECVKFCASGAMRFTDPELGLIARKKTVAEKLLDSYKEAKY